MNLLMAPMNTELCIERIRYGRNCANQEAKSPLESDCKGNQCRCNQERHLCNLGFVKGARILVVNEMNGSLIVRVKDSKIAIDRGIAKKIIVSNC